MADVKAILEQRGNTHGEFTNQARLTQGLKTLIDQENRFALQEGSTDVKLTPVQREAIDMMCHKLARIATGDPNVHDHWDDIAGYATLASQRIEV